MQWDQNGGKCGLCGDPHQVEKPRPHEAGGQYAKGIISRRYSVGQVFFFIIIVVLRIFIFRYFQEIHIEIELTANHLGKFEIYICPNNNPAQEATPECFQRHPLYLSGTKQIAFHIPEDSNKKDIFRYKVTLPAYVTCTQCVLQWTYFTGII